MTAKDKANTIALQNYYSALSKRAHNASRKEGLADYIAGYSSGRADALHEVCGDLKKLIEAGEVEYVTLNPSAEMSERIEKELQRLRQHGLTEVEV